MTTKNDLQSEIKVLRQTLIKQQVNLADNRQILDYLYLLWADFHICVIHPDLDMPAKIAVIAPDHDEMTGIAERVYPIIDQGYILSASRGDDVLRGSTSTAMFFDTITKMVKILYQRIINKNNGDSDGESGNGSQTNNPETILIAFQGHEIGKRKAYELLMGLDIKVQVTNYLPGKWGALRSATLKEMHGRGYDLSSLNSFIRK